ncbi:MAG: hypothetical protein D3922_03995 [Candidatus Electrothrix sp. AR1]|nr:hypothetical protein [Candidatus Electrothrix sp. AR1]
MLRLVNFIVFFLAVLGCPLFFAVSSLAVGIGKEVCEPYKPLVVRITTQFASGEENGFGFLIGERDDQFYIVTANHVVRSNGPDNPAKQVVLHFSWDPGSRGYKAELLYTMYGPLDLALLRIDKNKINGAERVSWEGRKWCRRWKLEEEVWFIGRAREWYIPPDKRAGILLRTEADLQGFIQVDINSVQPGTSGAPLLTRNGLVGMVVTDAPGKTRAVNIDYIRRFVSIENPYPWNLVNYDNSLRNGGTITTKPSLGYREVKKAEVVDSTFQRIRPPETTLGTPLAGFEGRRNPNEQPDRRAASTKKAPQIKARGSEEKQQSSKPSIQNDAAIASRSATMEHARNNSTEIIGNSVEQPAVAPPKAGDTLFEPLTKLEFIRLSRGCFAMGSPKEDKKLYSNEVPVHPVCVDAFWMGKYEVTLAQWAKVIGKRPARSQGSENHPAVPVTWDEVQVFISKLNKKTGRVFRLPTEAEWEYAARAGTATSRYWGDDISCDKAMYGNDANENSCVDYVQQQGRTVGEAAPVGSYPPNRFGLYDMLGNVREWCADWYGKEYYVSSPKDNPRGPSASSVDPQARVLRGGSWLDGSRIIRSAARKWLTPEKRYYDTGFRLVLVDQEGGSDGL